MNAQARYQLRWPWRRRIPYRAAGDGSPVIAAQTNPNRPDSEMAGEEPLRARRLFRRRHQRRKFLLRRIEVRLFLAPVVLRRGLCALEHVFEHAARVARAVQ